MSSMPRLLDESKEPVEPGHFVVDQVGGDEALVGHVLRDLQHLVWFAGKHVCVVAGIHVRLSGYSQVLVGHEEQA